MVAKSCSTSTPVSARCRLVHHQHPGLIGKCACELYHLLLGEPEIACRATHVERQAEPPHRRSASSLMRRQSTNPHRLGAFPRKMFSATDRCGTSVSS